MKGMSNPVDLPVTSEVTSYWQGWRSHPRPGHTNSRSRPPGGRQRPGDDFPYHSFPFEFQNHLVNFDFFKELIGIRVAFDL